LLIDALHRLIGLIVLVVALARLSGWISLHLQGMAFLVTRSQDIATFFLFLVLAPGVFVHELSHWLVAHLLGVPVQGFRVWPKRTRKGHIQMGAVEVRGAGPVSLALIGIAPFLVGTLLLVLLGGWLHARAHGLADWRLWVSPRGWTLLGEFFQQPAWPWRFYAIWLISNSMMPSPSDRDPLKPVLLGLLLLVGVAYFAGVMPTQLGTLSGALASLFDVLAGAFLLALVGNSAVAILLLLGERALAEVFGLQVEYR